MEVQILSEICGKVGEKKIHIEPKIHVYPICQTGHMGPLGMELPHSKF